MKSRIQVWGQGLAVRLPDSVAKHFDLRSDSEIEMLIQGDELVIKPVSTRKNRLDALLDQIEPNRLHLEVDHGEPVGEEAW